MSDTNPEQTVENALVIFIKNPIKGRTKTRIAQTTTDEIALNIYLELLTYTLNITKDLTCKKHLFYDRFIDYKDQWSEEVYEKQVQSGEDLGERMQNAFREVLAYGYKKVVLIGSDCGDLNPNIINTAFDALDTHEVVIGPALDGGYYLVGMRKAHLMLFDNKAWSTSGLYEATTIQLEALNISYHSLIPLSDIDHYEDWLAWKQK